MTLEIIEENVVAEEVVEVPVKTTEEILEEGSGTVAGEINACINILFALLPDANGLDTGEGFLTKKAIQVAATKVRADMMPLAKMLKQIRGTAYEAAKERAGGVAGMQAEDKKAKLAQKIADMQAQMEALEAELS